LWWNYFTFTSVGIRLSGSVDVDGKMQQKRVVRLARPKTSPNHQPVEVELSTDDADVTLFISSERDVYRFGYREEIARVFSPEPKIIDDGLSDIEEEEDSVPASRPQSSDMRNITWLGAVQNQHMTLDPPVGAAFTGMMFGLYAFGELQPCLDPADFAYAEIIDRIGVA
jgi:hypothetical protein